MEEIWRNDFLSVDFSVGIAGCCLSHLPGRAAGALPSNGPWVEATWFLGEHHSVCLESIFERNVWATKTWQKISYQDGMFRIFNISLFCSRFVDIQWMPKNSGTGYEAEKLKELGFTVRELTDHYNAQEIMAAQFPKEWNVWVFACSFRGMHRDKQMFKRIWSASIIYTSLHDYTFSQHWLLAWVEGPAASLSYDCLRAETKRHLGYWKSGG